jgi:hypothetical protein
VSTSATVIGSVGGVLLLVGLVAGGFEFSGSVMPRAGRIARILCFAVGGTLLLIAVGLSSSLWDYTTAFPASRRPCPYHLLKPLTQCPTGSLLAGSI